MLKALWMLVAMHAFAQTPAFEAATIKPSKDQPGHSGSHTRTGMIVMTGQTLKGLICAAYRVKDYQVSGGPKWMDGDRFDINARAEGAANDTQLKDMLQTLLSDRFKLVFHHEEKIGPAYALVLLKSGLKITPVEGSTGTNSNGSKGQLEVTGMTMSRFAETLSRELKTPVTDLTATPGAYNFKLQWSTEGDANDMQSALFAALQSQLGLKLESRKLSIDMIVVDSAEKPSEN
jgi:uncharacterized protein (TIGR03435 family)